MNYRAARRGRSHAEFKAKLGVVFEEADECDDCLRFFRDAGIRHDPALVQEAEELATLLVPLLPLLPLLPLFHLRRLPRRYSERLHFSIEVAALHAEDVGGS